MSSNDVEEQIGGAHQKETYGRGPAMYVLDDVKAWNTLPPEERAYNAARFVECRLGFSDKSAARKASPLWSGVMRYFPDALLAVARLSKKANDKHNPGEPLHWSREKSSDHGDCIARHQLNPEEIDPEMDEPHAVMVAWRALAQCQLIEEKRLRDAGRKPKAG